MRYVIVVLWMLCWSASPALAQVSVGIALPGVSIGINLPVFPDLVRVPGYPVYYAPRLNSNFFFYDGMYWVYERDNWYASSWYNGPWEYVAPEYVPLFVLRIPVGYYRNPPAYFRGWRSDAPPRWGEHWGNDWQRNRSGWDRWNRRSVPAPAPLPSYQRQYSGERYPRVEQQQQLRNEKYRYQPHDSQVRQRYQEQPAQRSQEQPVQRAPAPAQRGPQAAPQEGSPRPQESQRANPPSSHPQGSPVVPRTQPPQGAAPHEQPAPRPGTEAPQHGRGEAQPPRAGQGQERDRAEHPDRMGGEDRGQDRNR